MGRPEQPIAADAPFGDLALVLREIRNGTELTLEALADRIGYTPSALSKAAAGISLPGEHLLGAWAQACGQPERADELCHLRSELKQQRQRKSGVKKTKLGQPRRGSTVNVLESWPDPRELHTTEQVMDALRLLRVMPPRLTYSNLARMTGWPRSTVHGMLQRTTLPRYELYSQFLSARRPPASEEWRAAYARAEIDQERRRRELLAKKMVKLPPEAPETGSPTPVADVHGSPGRTPRKLFARWTRRPKPNAST